VEADEHSWLDIRLRRLAHTWRAVPGCRLK
jgi:hypothetical protein